LHRVAVNIKHLMIEIETSDFPELNDYQNMLDLLGQGMDELTTGFQFMDA
jgi:hypothetical protein